MQERRAAIAILGLVSLAGLACSGAGGGTGEAAARPMSIVAGPPAPPLALPGLDGTVTDLASLRGRPVIINFWATWCAPCKREIPSLVRLHRRLEGRGLEVLAISLDAEAEALRGFLGTTPLPFTVLWDPSKRSFASYGATVTPTSYILDREGRVVERMDGEVDWDSADMVKTIEALL